MSRGSLLAFLAGAVLALPAVGLGSDEPARFDVWEYRVRGNTLLPAVDIERRTYDQLGPGKSIEDVEKARTALEAAYRTAGYNTVFVDVPEQDIGRGVVVLNVTEGKVGRLTVTGSRYFANGWIREQVPEVREGAVPRFPVFQQEMNDLNRRSADRAVTPVLRPGALPGTVDVELKVADSLPFHPGVEVTNRNSANTTPTRINAFVSYDNLWQRDHSVSLLYQVAPENRAETEVWVGSYTWRLRGSDKSAVFYVVDNRSDVAALSGVSVIGNGRTYGAQFLWPLQPLGPLYQNVLLGAAYKDFGEALDTGTGRVETPIRYVNWSAAWNGTLAGESRTQQFGAAVNFGIRGVVNDAAQFAAKRYDAQPDYLYVVLNYGLTQTVPHGASVYLGLGLQGTTVPLVSNEQYALGGMESVRGYYEAEMLGDYGARTTLELRSPNVGPALWTPLGTLQALAFVDYGVLGLHHPLPEQLDHATLWSSGVGLQLAAGGLTAHLDWAMPFRDASTTKARDDRLLFRVKYGF